MKWVMNVSNAFHSGNRTGIQRVVRAVVAHFLSAQASGACDVVLVVGQGGGLCVLPATEALRWLAGERVTVSEPWLPSDLAAGDWFVDLDASWGDGLDLELLWLDLKRAGVCVAKVHYDAVPLLFPAFSHENTVYRFAENFSACLGLVDHWFCISEQVGRDLVRLCGLYGVGVPAWSLMPLGCDMEAGVAGRGAAVAAEPILALLASGTFAVCVATLEPRKNHALLLDAFDAWVAEGGRGCDALVLVGKQGWNVAGLVQRIKAHPLFNRRLFWVDDASDALVRALFGRALFSINLSHYEGFGLPVVEALALGCPVICSDHGAMAEAARGAACLVSLDVPSVLGAMRQLSDPQARLPFVSLARAFEPLTWADALTMWSQGLQALSQCRDVCGLPAQAVYLSIRPDALRRSLASVMAFMPFVESAVVLTTPECVAAMVSAVAGLALPVTVVSEAELGLVERIEDHQARNTALRLALYQHPCVAAEFVAFDDDYVAVAHVDRSVFFENGRYKAYSFLDDGQDWLGSYPEPTSFDLGIWRTVRYLSRCGLPRFLFNAHMPQVMNRALAVDVLKRTQGLGLDEWSCCFNVALHLYPSQFVRLPYRAAGWPQDASSWLPSGVPDEPLFVNVYGSELEGDVGAFVSRWQHELRDAMGRRALANPQRACVGIGHEGLWCSPLPWSVHPDEPFFVRLVADVPVPHDAWLEVTLGAVTEVFEGARLPSCLYVPASRLHAGSSVVLKLVWQTTRNRSVLEIPVAVASAPVSLL